MKFNNLDNFFKQNEDNLFNKHQIIIKEKEVIDLDVLSSFFEILKNKFIDNNEKHIIHLMNKLYQKDFEFYDENSIRDNNLNLIFDRHLIYPQQNIKKNNEFIKDFEFYDEKPIRDSNLDLTIKTNLIYCQLERFTENCIQHHDYNSDNEEAMEFLEQNIEKINEFIKDDENIHVTIREKLQVEEFSCMNQEDWDDYLNVYTPLKDCSILGSGQSSYQNLILRILFTDIFKQNEEIKKFFLIKNPTMFFHNDLIFKFVLKLKLIKNVNFKFLINSKYFLNYLFNDNYFSNHENKNKHQIIKITQKSTNLTNDIFTFVNDENNNILKKTHYRKIFFESLFWKNIIFCENQGIFSKIKKYIKKIKLSEKNKYKNVYFINFENNQEDMINFIKKINFYFHEENKKNNFLYISNKKKDKLKLEIDSINIDNNFNFENKLNEDLKEKIKQFLVK